MNGRGEDGGNGGGVRNGRRILGMEQDLRNRWAERAQLGERIYYKSWHVARADWTRPLCAGQLCMMMAVAAACFR